MKLYFIPTLCSLASHIVAREADLDVEFVKVAYKTKTTPDGANYLETNPLGYVPALVLDGGQTITESPAILQYLADQVPERGLVAPAGTLARYQTIGHLHVLGAEIHKRVAPLLDPRCTDDFKTEVRAKIAARLAFLDDQLGEGPYFGGDQFTVTDAYTFAILGGLRTFFKFDLLPYPRLLALEQKVAQRPAVIDAVAFEGPLSLH